MEGDGIKSWGSMSGKSYLIVVYFCHWNHATQISPSTSLCFRRPPRHCIGYWQSMWCFLPCLCRETSTSTMTLTLHEPWGTRTGDPSSRCYAPCRQSSLSGSKKWWVLQGWSQNWVFPCCWDLTYYPLRISTYHRLNNIREDFARWG